MVMFEPFLMVIRAELEAEIFPLIWRISAAVFFSRWACPGFQFGQGPDGDHFSARASRGGRLAASADRAVADQLEVGLGLGFRKGRYGEQQAEFQDGHVSHVFPRLNRQPTADMVPGGRKKPFRWQQLYPGGEIPAFEANLLKSPDCGRAGAG